MSDFVRWSPNDIFNTGINKDGVVSIQTAFVSASVGANNIIGLTSGQTARILGYDIQAAVNSNSAVTFQNDLGSSLHSTINGPPNTSNPYFQAMTVLGYFETGTSRGLNCTVSGAAANITVRYIKFTP